MFASLFITLELFCQTHHEEFTVEKTCKSSGPIHGISSKLNSLPLHVLRYRMAWSIVEEDGTFANTPKMRSFKRAIDSGLGDEVMVVDGKERLRQGLAAKS